MTTLGASSVKAASAEQNNLAKFDSRMAVANAIADQNGVQWIDGRFLPIEGRAFAAMEHDYDRLPSNVTEKVNEGVRSMKHHTAGMQFRFVTDSKRLRVKWVPYNPSLAMDHMPSTGVSGLDFYRQAADGAWQYVATGRITNPVGGVAEVPWTPGTPCIINLPLYNGVKSFSLGIDPGASVAALPLRSNGVEKPVVFYGTSITQGGCASRPGLSFVNIVGRDLDVPVVNLGFAGSGWMEFEMSEHLAAIDASCYVLDCLWNMCARKADDTRPHSFDENYEPFIRNLRAKRPDVPIVMAEMCDVFCGGRNDKDIRLRALYEKLIAEGWKKLDYLPKTSMYSGDREGTVDGCHPNDLGMRSLADAFGKCVKSALAI